MIDRKAFELMRQGMERFDALREQLIKKSRDVLKSSKAAIYSIHRNDLSAAVKQLSEAKKGIGIMNSLIKKEPHLAAVGSYSEALEEYVEAACYYSFITKQCLPTAKQLNVDAELYLPGICDLIGELLRKAVNSAIAKDYATAMKIKDFVSAVYEELMMFDFRNSPLRRKFDGIKYSLEKLEDLALQLKLGRKV